MPDPSLLTFPCDFPIKVMGLNTDDFSRIIIDLVQQHASDFDATTLSQTSSSQGKYLSLTCTIRAHSQAQLDGLYRALTSDPAVKLVL